MVLEDPEFYENWMNNELWAEDAQEKANHRMGRDNLIDFDDFVTGDELLEHAERVLEDFVPLVEKVSMEDKLILAHEEMESSLEPWEIQEIAQGALARLQRLLDLPEDEVDLIFDVIYDAVSDGADRSR